MFHLKPNKNLLFLTVFAVCSACTTQNSSIAFINTPRLMQQYHGTAIKRQEIAHAAAIWQRSLDSLTAVVSALRPASAARQEQLARYRVALQQRIQAASSQSDQVLLNEVNAYLKTYGKTHGFDFILGANESGNIVYAADSQDLTNSVLTGLNREYDQYHSPSRASVE